MQKRTNPATILALVALIFAATGGAYAATGGGDGLHARGNIAAKKKKKSNNNIRGPAGPRGATGAVGPAGSTGGTGPAGPAGPKGESGPAGSNGAAGESLKVAVAGSECKEGGTSFSNSIWSGYVCNGEKGKAGSPGSSGAPGTAGTSATTGTFSGAQNGCKEGGIEVKSASPTVYVCNGEKGTNGQTGFTETLPSGKTETGTWNISANHIVTESVWTTSISFAIPLSGAVEETTYYFTKSQTEKEEFTGGCAWEESNASARPTAPNGTLCIFTAEEHVVHTKFSDVYAHEVLEGFGPTGAVMSFTTKGASEGSPGEVRESGVWAVTAP